MVNGMYRQCTGICSLRQDRLQGFWNREGTKKRDMPETKRYQVQV